MDTAGDLPDGWREDYQIDLIPINIIHQGKTYLQGIDLGYEDFYRLVESTDTLPSTSQPTPYQFTEFYRAIGQPGDTILSIHITEKLSGTMASAKAAADELKEEFNIIPFDSASGTLSMGMLAKEARQLARAGKSMAEILHRLEFIRAKMELVFTVDDLKFAQMSGRIKHLQAALASLLNVKPIIELKDGIIEMGEKVRSRAKSIDVLLKKMRKKFGDQRVVMGVVHARDKEMGQVLMRKVVSEFNCAEVIFAEISISLAAHFGPGALGVVGYPIE
jgi:DegV family protein with EDD domain